MNYQILNSEAMNTLLIKRFSTAFIILLVSIAMISCSDSSTDSDPGNGNGDPAANEVMMTNQSFTPENLEVEVGTTVTWINDSSEIHTVTSGTNGDHDGIFNSGEVSPGEEYSYTFDETGTYDYYCIPHLNVGMTGTVTVTD